MLSIVIILLLIVVFVFTWIVVYACVSVSSQTSHWEEREEVIRSEKREEDVQNG